MLECKTCKEQKAEDLENESPAKEEDIAVNKPAGKYLTKQ